MEPPLWAHVELVLVACLLVQIGGFWAGGLCGPALRSLADLWLTRRGLGAAGPPPRSGLPRCLFAECPGDGLPPPAHTCRREFGVVAELLGDPLGAAPAA